MKISLKKYPRTPHLEGSRLQPGDEDLDSVPFQNIKGRFVVVEEKLDGANCAISFDEQGQLCLQSRGHYLTGGMREKQFHLLKQWASCHQDQLREVLGDRFICYGEWTFAKHTVFYDDLPHYFHEFDLYDRETDSFLSTERRLEILQNLPMVSVPVLWQGKPKKLEQITSLVQHSLYKTDDWRERLTTLAEERELNVDQVWKQTDSSDQMEGLYLKIEEDGIVIDRLKWIRASFLTAVVDSGSHWLSRPILPNQLSADVDLFGGQA